MRTERKRLNVKKQCNSWKFNLNNHLNWVDPIARIFSRCRSWLMGEWGRVYTRPPRNLRACIHHQSSEGTGFRFQTLCVDVRGMFCNVCGSVTSVPLAFWLFHSPCPWCSFNFQETTIDLDETDSADEVTKEAPRSIRQGHLSVGATPSFQPSYRSANSKGENRREESVMRGPFSEAVKLFLANQFYILTYRSVHLFTTRWKKGGGKGMTTFTPLFWLLIFYFTFFFGFFATGPTNA